MATEPTLASELRDSYSREFARIHEDFLRTGDGRTALAARTALVETIARRLWERHISPAPQIPEGVALVALGGFGRGWLFPYSDVDILFLHAGSGTEGKLKDPIRCFSQEMWDLRLKLSPATRTLAECDRVDPDNFEFAMSLLDARYLAGDRDVFARLHDEVVPKLVSREADLFIKRLSDLTRSRHAKFGDAVFHLEPNVKDGPGGMRDYNVASWLALLSAMEQLRAWPTEGAPLPASARPALDRALEFLMAVRCFLHFRHARDDNSLAWDAQEDAAAQRVGLPAVAGLQPAADAMAAPLAPSDWMRIYFSQARRVHRICLQLLEELPTTRHSLYRQFQSLRARLANPEFSVVGNLVFFRQADPPPDAAAILRCFRFLARHGLHLSSAAEARIEQSLPALAPEILSGAELWHPLQDILSAPHAADTLRAMHSLRLLTLLIPEFAGVDSLVVRDYSHRFTVDEHTFVAIDNLHQLHQSQSRWDQRYAELLDELEQPDLLYLAILLHDIGKGAKSDNHVSASVSIAHGCIERLDLDELDRETVLFLVGRHLEMSATLRRDIFDPETIHAFAEKVETPERLKMLCLLTHADIKAVNPEALTPWKAENIWQLYIATSNHMNRSLDERVHADARDEVMTHLRTLAPAAGKRLENFLEGLPRRYLLTHGAGEVLSHLEMTARLAQDSVQLDLRRGRHWYELTVVTPDRPLLFSTIAGVLAGWGMNIVKAAAFSNSVGIVVDTFYFTDRFRTLELNIPEWERFKTSVHDVLLGGADLERLLLSRQRSDKKQPPKVRVETKVDFDDACSAHSTLVEVIAQDQPGLLHRISSAFARENCNIEIALIETEGQTALDVFYLTSAGAKISAEHQRRLATALLTELSA